MDMSIEFDWEGFKTLLRHHWENLSYLIAYRRLSDDREDNCGTWKISDTMYGADPEVDLEAEGSAERDDLIDQAVTWLRGTALGNADSDEVAPMRFRVRGMGHKGSDKLFARNLTVRSGVASELVRGPARASVFTELNVGLPVEATRLFDSLVALAQHYNHFGALCLNQVEAAQRSTVGIQDANQELTRQLAQMLHVSRSETADALSAFMTHLKDTGQSQNQRQADQLDAATVERQMGVLDGLVREVGSTARLFLAGRDLSPAQIQILERIGQDQELMAILSDPDIELLLDNPMLRGELLKAIPMSIDLARRMKAEAEAKAKAEAEGTSANNTSDQKVAA